MRLKEKKLLQKFAATLKKFSAQGAKKVEYGKIAHLSAPDKKGNRDDLDIISIKTYVVVPH